MLATEVTVANFREAFPVFQDDLQYMGPEIQFWIDLGLRLTNIERWGDIAYFGLQLFVAHNLALEAQNACGGGSGGPGGVVGILTGGTIDKVSYQRDASAAMDPKAGHWNLTSYGMRYRRLVLMIGAGPLQVGADFDSNRNYSAAWPGPYPYPQVGS